MKTSPTDRSSKEFIVEDAPDPNGFGDEERCLAGANLFMQKIQKGPKNKRYGRDLFIVNAPKTSAKIRRGGGGDKKGGQG